MRLIYAVLFLEMVYSAVLSSQSDETPVYILKKHTASVKALAFREDGLLLGTGGDDRMIYFWETATGELLGSIENYFGITSLQFTPDNSILAACGPDIKLMERNGRLIRTFSGYTTDIWSIDYNEKVNRLIAGSYARTIRVWNFEKATLELTLTGHDKSCLPVKINPAGDRAVSGSLDKSVRLWDLNSGSELKKMDIHSENIFAVDFHPSGKYVISASADRTLRLWNLESGKVIRTFTGHEGSIFDVRFSPDGNYLLSCSADKTIILWEAATGKMLHTFTGHTSTVNVIRFSRDGQRFATGSDDHTVRIWQIEKQYFVEPYFGKEIEQAKAGSPLFAARKPDESKQSFAVRQAEAKKFLESLYDKYYQLYLQQLSQQPW